MPCVVHFTVNTHTDISYMYIKSGLGKFDTFFAKSVEIVAAQRPSGNFDLDTTPLGPILFWPFCLKNRQRCLKNGQCHFLWRSITSEICSSP